MACNERVPFLVAVLCRISPRRILLRGRSFLATSAGPRNNVRCNLFGCHATKRCNERSNNIGEQRKPLQRTQQ
jgi:hypothetical protein